MSRALMARHCAAQAMGPARLDGWRYVITRDGYASVIPCAGSVVHGVLWRLMPRDLAALDLYENIGSGLYHRRMLLAHHRGKPVRALTYLGRGGKPGRPRPGYQEGIVIPAAQAWGLPEYYVTELARWSPPARQRGPMAEPGR